MIIQLLGERETQRLLRTRGEKRYRQIDILKAFHLLSKAGIFANGAIAFRSFSHGVFLRLNTPNDK